MNGLIRRFFKNFNFMNWGIRSKENCVSSQRVFATINNLPDALIVHEVVVFGSLRFGKEKMLKVNLILVYFFVAQKGGLVLSGNLRVNDNLIIHSIGLS